MDERRHNPIVDRYVTTDLSLETIVENQPPPRTLAVQAILLVQRCLNGKLLAKDALTAAQQVPMSGVDSELALLLLAGWAELSCRIGRPSEAEAVVHQARAMISADTHPVVHAAIIHAESVLADITGDMARREQLIREMLELVPDHSPRRKFIDWELSLFLARQGRGVECRTTMRDLTWQCNERFHISRLLLVRFIDAVETGRSREAAEIQPQLEVSPNELRELGRTQYRAYQVALQILHASETEPPFARLPPAEAVGDMPMAAQVLHALARRDSHAALRLARLESQNVLSSIFSAGFAAYNLIRAELAAGTHENARRLLRMRQARGNHHYLDDLFSARAEWLAGNRKAAADHFAAALAATDRYEAGGRLDFELRLASELSQADLLQLTRSATARPSHAMKPAAPRPAKPTHSEAPAVAMQDILGRSEAIEKVRQAIRRFAPLDAPIMVSGETGTGKELVARVIHTESQYREHPFIAVNCGSITETLLESELFGHERGAFTGADRANHGLFEDAGKGTIFLDEIGTISPRLQTGLLRVLETGEIRAVGSTRTRRIHCRIIAATNADLAEMTQTGLFRKDLLFRLQRLGLYIPPLRERTEDILLIVRHFIDLGRPVGQHATMSNDLQQALQHYDWPGNIRELRNVIERMRLMHSDKRDYTLADLDLKFQAVNAPQHSERGNEEYRTRNVQHGTDERGMRNAEHGTEGGERGKDERGNEEYRTRNVQHGTEDARKAPVDAILQAGRSPLRQMERLQELFARYRQLTRSEVIQILDVSPNTATKYLKDLCDNGFIERVEPSQSSRSYYFRLVQPSPGTASTPTSE